MLIAGGVTYAAVARSLPDPTAQARGRDQTTKVYDRDDELIVELFAEQNRTDVPLAEIPILLRNAVIATEDKRFYEHAGVDPLGILRALVVDIRTRSTAQGGSTITQQYVVNAFIEREDTLMRKLREALLAYRLEKDHSKDEILEMYLNTIYFGHGAYGIESASQIYFDKSVGDLSLAESAMIAAVIRSPGTWSPYLDPDAAEARRVLVLGLMLEQGYIAQADHDAAVAAEVVVAGLEQSAKVAPYFVEHVKAELTEEYGAEAVYRGGLIVKTSIDLDMQRAAEEVARAALDEEDDPSAALVALDPRTGEILAMVGGTDFASQQFNVAVQGRRQPGSAFKPFVLVTALENGVSPEQTFESGAVTLDVPGSTDWSVTGASGGGPMRLREATERSINAVFAQLILDVGADRVAQTAQRMGITSDIVPVPAIALGGLERGVSPLEMASAYGSLANGGEHAAPVSILEVRDLEGTVLFASEPTVERVVDADVAYLTTDLLTGVITRGTGRAAAIGRPAAGKTGTTQAYRDAWFVGYTPDVACAVWVGYPEEQREMDSVHGRRVTGGSFPAEIWAAFMKRALGEREPASFARPSGLVNVEICRDTGLATTEWCESRSTGLFLADHTPRACDLHTGPAEVELPNLIGRTKEEALALLGSLQLLFDVDEREVAGVPVGIVADQDPPGGTVVTTDTVISLVVSTGERDSEPPVPAFDWDPDPPVAGEAIEFDASASTDDGEITGYLWELGDGGEATGVLATHEYALPGEYEVTLWVTDDEDQVESLTLTVTVE